LRIFPLYYGVLLVLMALTPVLHFRWGQSLFYLATYTDNIALWTRTYAYLPHININHFWSLQVEEQFYLIWPLVVYKVRNRMRLVQIALVTCVIVLLIRICLVIFHAHFTNQFLTMSPTFSCCDNLLYGCTLALLLRSEYRQRILDLAPKIFTICCLCLLPMAIVGHGLILFNSAAQQTFGVSLLGIGGSALIAMALRPASKTERLFDGSFLRFFGKYSYGLYVFHYTIDANLTSPLRDYFQQQTHSKVVALLGAALIVAGLSVVVALLSYHLYEIQFLKLKRFFSYKSHDAQTAPALSR
jgi:peptidoglycan/LPS O-acetylase OafA/YrhL